MMANRYIMIHHEYGVYLGDFWGLGFWSKLDPADQDSAVVFDSQAEGFEFAKSWDAVRDGHMDMDDLSFINVGDGPDGKYATIEECVAAGAPSWNPNDKGSA